MGDSVYSSVLSVFEVLSSSINVSFIASLVGMVLIACISLYLVWFGIKKLILIIINALYDNSNWFSNKIDHSEFINRRIERYYRKHGSL